MNRTIGGIPLLYWIVGIGGGIALFAWMKKRGATAAASPSTTGKTGQQSFTQAQEVQDFQIFSALTGAQQASDLNFLSEVAGLFSGGSSTGTAGGSSGAGGGGGTIAPAPPSTGTAPPTTVPQSLQGSGYVPKGSIAPVTSTTGAQYSPISTPAQLAGYTGTTYYEPVPGVFEPATTSDKFAPGTTLYIPS